jgi:hypothetical protein
MKVPNHYNNDYESQTSTELRRLFVSGSLALDSIPSPFISLPWLLSREASESPVTNFSSGILSQTSSLHDTNRDPIPSSPCWFSHYSRKTTVPLSHHHFLLLSAYHQLDRSVGCVSGLSGSAVYVSTDRSSNSSTRSCWGRRGGSIIGGGPPGRYRRPKAPSLFTGALMQKPNQEP